MLKVKWGAFRIALSLAVIGPKNDWIGNICNNSQDGVGSIDRNFFSLSSTELADIGCD